MKSSATPSNGGTGLEIGRKWLGGEPEGVVPEWLQARLVPHLEALEPYTTHCAARRPDRIERRGPGAMVRSVDCPGLRCGDEGCKRRKERTHVGRGSQYCSEYQAELKKRGIRISMSGKGNCYAMVETFVKTLKSELIWRTIFQTGTEAKLTIGRPE